MIDRVAPFRDIRPDLEARIHDAMSKRDEFLTKVKECEADMRMYHALLERENQRLQQADGVRAAAQEPDEALPEFVFKSIQMRPQNKDELRESANRAGYDVDGRSIHATTVNLQRGGKIIEKNGVYTAVDSTAH